MELNAMMRSAYCLVAAILGAGMCLASPGTGTAHAEGSLLNLDIETSELKMALAKALDENRGLQQSLLSAEKSLQEMRTGLAASSGEAEIFKRQTAELKLRIEALGLESQQPGSQKLEQRLLNAVSDMRVLTRTNKGLSEALIRLSEAAALYAKTSESANAQARLQLESEVRNSNAALGVASASSVSNESALIDCQAISVKDDLALVVMNVGTKKGVKVGMPFDVFRSQRVIGSVRVVDVRDKISGAVIQNLSSEKETIKVGDHLKIAAQP